MKNNFKFGFTMAEAILVMTILGIIATIMISTLKPAEFKEKSLRIMAKKVLSEIDVATSQIIMNNTAEKQKNNKSSWVDEALPKKYLLRFKEAAQFLGVSLSILERLAKEADAIYR